MNATAALPVVGVVLAGSVFQLTVADASWQVVESLRLTRTLFGGPTAATDANAVAAHGTEAKTSIVTVVTTLRRCL